MVTYGFYNSINHDRVYDATQMSEIFDGIIRDGVYQYVGNKFLVDINGLEGFQVRVGTGRAWFNHTWTKNDAPLILTLPAPPTLDNYYRADAIVIDINSNVNVRENKITYVTGTEVANNPSPPYPELLDGEHKQVPLAYIVRRGAETEINAANINYVVGSNPCPYVTAPVQAVDLSAHVAQWQAAWEQWFYDPNGYIKTQERAFEAEITAAEALISDNTDDVIEDVAEFRVWIASQKSQFNGWMDESENTFNAWFANLHYILDGDVAGHLQNEIEGLQDRVVPIEKGGTGNNHGHIQSGHKDTNTTMGEFATAEGMNTLASGKCAHAEGAGNYTYAYQNAHVEGDILWPTDETTYMGIEFYQPNLLTYKNVTGKAGGQTTYTLDMPGTNDTNVSGSGSLNNIQAAAWAIFSDDNNYYFTGGEVTNNNGTFTINANMGNVKLQWTGTIANQGVDDIPVLGGAYNYTYSVVGNRSSGRGAFHLKFLAPPYTNDVIVALSGNELRYQGEDSTNESGGEIQSVYAYTILKNKTTGEILKKEIGCMGTAATEDPNYIGINNSNDVVYIGGDVEDVGLFSYDYEDTNETIRVKDIVATVYTSTSASSRSVKSHSSSKSVRYWYINGSNLNNSSILVKHTFRLYINRTNINSSATPYMDMTPYYTTQIRLDPCSYIEDETADYGLLIIKAGNTDTYSFETYYSAKWEKEAVYNNYAYKILPTSDIVLPLNNGEYIHETVDISSINKIQSMMLLLNNQIVRSYNLHKYYSYLPDVLTTAKNAGIFSGGYTTITTAVFRFDIVNNRNVAVVCMLSFDLSGSGDVEYPTTLDVYYSTSQPNGAYKLVLSQNSIYNPTMYDTETGKGLSSPITWIPAGEHLTLGSAQVIASGNYAHAEGYQTIAKGDYSHAEGYNDSTKVDHSKWPAASGRASHTEGSATTAIGVASHAEGYKTIANGNYSHASGNSTEANGSASMSIGSFTKANGNHSFAGGYGVKANDEAQFVYGYDAGEWSGSYDIVKKLHTSLFGLPGEPRVEGSSYDETANISDIDELNTIADKNKCGISIFLSCPTTKNGKYYKTILPNNTFGTYLEFIDLVTDSPSDQIIAYSGRVLKLNPSGLIEAVKLFETSSLTGVMTVGQTKSFTIGGTTYQYPLINLTNAINDSVSTSSVTKYLKYVLIRLY